MTRPKVAAAIVTFNKKQAVLDLVGLLDRLGVPTFLTENACSDGTREAIREGFPQVSLLASEANLGGTGGFDCAVLAALSSGCDYVVLLDDDVLPDEDCLDRLQGFLDQHPDFVMAAPSIYITSRPDTLQEAGGGVDLSRPGAVVAWHRFKVNPELPELLEIDYASACCLMVRAEAILRLGVMDWNFFIFSDDVDWSLRLRRAFGKAACVTRARALHDFPWAKPFSPMRLYFLHRNNLLMLARARQGELGKVPLQAAVLWSLDTWWYARIIGDREVADTAKAAFTDAWRGRYGKWNAPVLFGKGRKVLDREYFRRRRIGRVLLDITIEDFDTPALEAIRACGGVQMEVDVLCDDHRQQVYRDKGLFRQVYGRAPGRRRLLTETFRALRRRDYDLVVTDAYMGPRRPTSMVGRRAALYHDGKLYQAASRPWLGALAYWAVPVTAKILAPRLMRRFLHTPAPGLPPTEAAPLLECIGVDPKVGQPWARPWVTPFTAPPADPVHPPPMELLPPAAMPEDEAAAAEPTPAVAAVASLSATPPPLGPGEEAGGYRCWCAARERTAADRYRPAAGHGKVSFSVLVPVYNPRPGWLEECIASVRVQTYGGWELVLVDDASDLEQVGRTLGQAQGLDPRIRVERRTARGGISVATNRAGSLATGDYLLFLDQDDRLDPHCLAAFAQAIGTDPAPSEVALWYADEDRFDEKRRRIHPGFKPDYSPDLLLGTNYLHHPLLVERGLFHALGGLRPAFDGSQDYDLALRATEARSRVVHVADVLYHMRIHPGSLAGDADSKPEAHGRGRKALAEALERRGVSAEVGPSEPPFPGFHVPRRKRQGMPTVSVLVAPDGAGEVVEGEARAEAWAGCEWLLADGDGGLPRRFNAAARRAKGEVLLFADPALRPQRDWQGVLLPHLAREELGLVGGKLLYPEGQVHSCGLVLGLGGAAGRWHHGAGQEERGYGGWLALEHEVSALPWRFLAIRRDLFLDSGLFDEGFEVHGFDVDLALRLGHDRGLRHLVVPGCRGVLHGRPFDPAPEPWSENDLVRLWDRQGTVLRRGDPYLNPNLSLLDESVQMLDAVEDSLRARGAFAAYDAVTARRLGRRFPGRMA